MDIRSRRLVQFLLLSSVAVLVLSGVLPAQARAATAYDHVGEFGGLGSGPGQFGHGGANNTGPGRVAVHEQSGKVFVVDTVNHRIQVFEPTATGADLAFAFGDASVIDSPVGIAIDQASAVVYVTTGGGASHLTFSGGELVKFLPQGADPINDPAGYAHDDSFDSPAEPESFGAWGFAGAPPRGGIAVDNSGGPGQGDVLLADPADGVVWRFDPDGALEGSFDGSDSPDGGFDSLYDLAIDSEGDALVADLVTDDGARVGRFEGAEASFGDHLETLPMPASSDGLVGPTVAVNPDTDEVLVGFKPPGDLLTTPARIAQFEADTLVRNFGAPGDGFGLSVNGLAIRGPGLGNGRLYAVGVNTHSGDNNRDPRVQTFDDTGPLANAPAVGMDEPFDVTATEATFTGTVNPGGAETAWRFEYRPEGSGDWHLIPELDGDAGDGTDPVPVGPETATGLEPNTDYEARLCADNQVSAGNYVCSDPEAFSTEPGPPIADTGQVAFLSDSGATLQGEVNPRNSETTYRFEWGTDPNYGNVTPIPDGDAGDGGKAVAVSVPIDGLDPGTTYHFRLVAENEFGQVSEGANGTFGTLAESAGLRPERAYELVSPLPTGGIDVIPIKVTISEDGDRALFASIWNSIPAIDGQITDYFAERSPDGWKAEAAGPEPAGTTWSDHGGSAFGPDDLSRIVITTESPLDPDDQNRDLGCTFPNRSECPHGPGTDIYVREPGGDWTWISRDPRIPAGMPQTDARRVGRITAIRLDGGPSVMSSDARVIAFRTARPLDDAHTGSDHAYKWSDGDLVFLGTRPDGTVSSGGSDIAGPNDRTLADNAVSRDGSRVVVRTQRPEGDAGAQALYVHQDGGPIIDATAPSGVEPTGNQHPRMTVFGGGSTDLSRIIFTSASRLTPDAGASHYSTEHSDLYAFDLVSGALRNLTPRLDGVVDPDLADDPAVGDRARVLGVTAISQDARRVYFVADGQLDAEPSPLGEEPSPDGRNLYLAELDGIAGDIELRFIAGSLGPDTAGDSGDRGIWRASPDQPGPRAREAHASRDGSVLAFSSLVALTDKPTGGMRQAYVYDTEARSLACASCPSDGSDPTGPVKLRSDFLSRGGSGGTALNDTTVKRWVSDDGTLYFNTRTPLLPADTNDAHDVYEYRSGQLRLVSGGGGRRHSTFAGASGDGRTVFFRTSDALVAQDIEPGVIKLYAARVGGGFPAPPLPPPECVGDGCQDPAPEPPAHRPPPSSEVEVPGNPPEASISAAALTTRQARRLARGKRIGLRAEVSGPGRVAAVVRARLRRGGSMTRAGRAATRVREAGEVVVSGLRLNRPAQRALRRQGQLAVRIVARYRGEASGQRVRLGDRTRMQRRVERLRQRADRQAKRGNDTRARRLRQRARRLNRQSRRLNRTITAGGSANGEGAQG